MTEPNWQPTLEDELVLLRPLRKSDHDALFQVASDPLIWEQHPDQTRYRPDGFTAFFQASLDSGGALVIIDKATGEMIGSSRYNTVPGAPDAIEIGWTFLARRYWGGRYNQAVKMLMMQHAFQYVSQVVYYIAENNIRSQRAIEKLGAERIEDPPEQGLPVKNPDHWVYRIMR